MELYHLGCSFVAHGTSVLDLFSSKVSKCFCPKIGLRTFEFDASVTVGVSFILLSFADRDSARWGLSPKIVRRRRVLFWDLFVGETWQVIVPLAVSIVL